jgi:hypothetical protein
MGREGSQDATLGRSCYACGAPVPIGTRFDRYLAINYFALNARKPNRFELLCKACAPVDRSAYFRNCTPFSGTVYADKEGRLHIEDSLIRRASQFAEILSLMFVMAEEEFAGIEMGRAWSDDPRDDLGFRPAALLEEQLHRLTLPPKGLFLSPKMLAVDLIRWWKGRIALPYLWTGISGRHASLGATLCVALGGHDWSGAGAGAQEVYVARLGEKKWFAWKKTGEPFDLGSAGR